MPVNKDALSRYRIIDKLLASRKGYTYEQIADICSEELKKDGIEGGVSKITIRKDIANMCKEFGVEIETLRFRGHERPLAYKESSKTIKGETLVDPTINELQQAISILETVEGISYVQPAIKSIKDKLTVKTGEDASKYISFANPPELKNSDKVWKLYKNIYMHHPLLVKYQPVGRDEREIDFQPYFLKCYNNRWFLFGWDYNWIDKKDPNKTPGKILNLAVDRINDYKVSKRPSSQIRKCQEDFKTYFDNVIGVTYFSTAELTTIKFRVHINEKYGDGDLHRIVTKPIHKSQRLVEETADYSDFTIEVYPNNELDAVLREFEHIEVLEPQFVRDEFVKRLSNISVHYPELNTQPENNISDK